MTGRIKLVDIIKKGEKLAKNYSPVLDDKQSYGFKRILSNVTNGGMGVGVGPPGTGKTVIFNMSHAEVFDKLDEDEVIVHVAPTNRLLEDTAVRTIALLMRKGYGEQDLAKSIRIYGSRFEPQRINGCKDIKIIFTTGYQPGALRSLLEFKGNVHLMIDEASRTALHEVFISLSMAISEELKKGTNEDFLSSFNVIGDPMQAIVESFGPRWKSEQLIVYRLVLTIIPEEERKEVIKNPPLMFELAENYASSSNIKYFFLETTYRMPAPSELLVSVPFYARKVKARKSSLDAMKNILSNIGSIQSFIKNATYLGKKKELREVIDNALESCIPVVYLKDRGNAYQIPRRPPDLEEFDAFRALLGAEVASYIALKTVVPNILVISPYNEIIQQSRLYVMQKFRSILMSRVNDIGFATVHSALGSEADAIVAIMGKEYIGKEHETMYFQTPELINVQLSRHNRILVIIGNIEKLAENMEKVEKKELRHVAEIKTAVEELRREDSIASVEVGD